MAHEEMTQRMTSSSKSESSTIGLKATSSPIDAFKPRTSHAAYDSIFQISRATVLFSVFITAAICLHVQQWLGAALYWINRIWFYSWQAVIKESTAILMIGLNQWAAPAKVRISGDSSVEGQIRQSSDGKVVHDFPDRLVLISNHQIYTDWIFLWWTAYCAGHHGHLFVVLKESLRMVPIIGPGLMFFSWIFLSRSWEADKPRLQHRMSHLSNAKARTPMWLLIFPEGTNMSAKAHPVSKKWSQKVGIPELDLTLVPRTRGLQFCLQELAQSIDWVYDCTLAYDGIPPGEYGQEVYSLKALYVGGQRAPLVHLYWRRFAVRDIPVDDPEAFDRWLIAQWLEKENILKHHQQYGYFPAHNGYVQADVKLNKLADTAQIFLGLLAVLAVWFMFRLVGLLPMN